ncbi:uroporphyrinogen decarboxylase family protein [Candidatus Contubernalis alkaliaceticus]|uniref:uroporphyrinogen decarboxylase family protein n=1 Tax=Candidatus Contubernalis alkaliaceticus TaxID=338645 RepID=UPI001F4BFCFD|nr:uroporphyrinogen decarboxylase family protein [Candidatus Contubernalis alkalaceticus]UNC91590.1 hypothetical protein HUE98_05500 [Candidatus Contubernalis alkalaceticus]
MSIKLILDAYQGKKVHKVPWVPYAGVHCAYLIEESAEVYLQNPDLMVKGVLQAAQRYQVDGIPLLFDVSVEAMSMGCEYKWNSDNAPTILSHPLAEQSIEEAALKIPTAEEGRWPILIEAGKRIMEEKGDWALLGLCCGPLTLASHLRGVKLFTDMVKNKPLAKEIITFCGEVCAHSASIYRDIGCEVIGIVDPVASQVNPVIFKEFEVPACQPALEVIRSAGRISSFLTCGDASKVMEEICRLGVDSFSCDEQVSLTYARDLALKYGLGFTGSLNVAQSLTLGLMDPGKDTLVSMAAGGMTGYILAPGCNMPYHVPPENVLKVLEAKEWFEKFFAKYPDHVPPGYLTLK